MKKKRKKGFLHTNSSKAMGSCTVEDQFKPKLLKKAKIAPNDQSEQISSKIFT